MNNKQVAKGLWLVLTLCITSIASGQNVGINTDGSLPNANAILDIKSGNKGILIPRIDSNARKLIPNTIGLLVYDSTYHSFWYNTGITWVKLSTGMGWSLTGNEGVSGSPFLGTIDASPLLIKVNNQPSGFIHHLATVGNTYWGLGAGAVTTTGLRNTAIGYASLFSNTTGSYNIASGDEAMRDNTIGDENSAFGSGALVQNTTGNRNTSVGYEALLSSMTGSNNTSIGYRALSNNTTGSGNTAIGYLANISGNVSNSVAIGSNAVVNASNKVHIGNAAITVIEGQVPYTTPSDGRFKYNIQENVGGLDFILKLRPVTYQFDVKRFDDQLRAEPETGKQLQVSGRSIKLSTTVSQEAARVDETMQKSYDEAAQIRRTGFIAQEVEKAAIAAGYNFSGIIKPKTAQEHYSLSYESFVVPLVKAVQEQQQVIDALNKKMEEQDKKMEVLKSENKQLLQLQQQVVELTQIVNTLKSNK